MFEEAMHVTTEAEIFVVMGTSLIVHPAAGLLQYAPYGIPKFVVDKKIPLTGNINNLFTIEKPATKGIEELKNYLNRLN